MKFTQIGTMFQCQCDDRDFDEYLVGSILHWCRQTATTCHPHVASVSEYDVADMDEGLDKIHTRWSVRIYFDGDEEAVAFKLVLDGFDAEVTCSP